MEPEPEVPMLDLLKLLKPTAKITDLDDVAKKDDLNKLQDTVSSHALEIKQLRDDLSVQSKRIQSLEDSLGSQAARSPNRTQPEVSYTPFNQYGGPQFQNKRVDEWQRYLVFEGIPALSQSDS